MKELIWVQALKVWLLITYGLNIQSSYKTRLLIYYKNTFGSKYSKTWQQRWKIAPAAPRCPQAIRPSNVFQTPSIAKYLDKDQLKIYTLIWNRLWPVKWRCCIWYDEGDLVSKRVIFTANGSQIQVWRLYGRYNDSDKNKMLPDMAEGDTVKGCDNAWTTLHATSCTYSEATD